MRILRKLACLMAIALVFSLMAPGCATAGKAGRGTANATKSVLRGTNKAIRGTGRGLDRVFRPWKYNKQNQRRY